MKTILNNFFGFIKTKPRLFIEYLMIGAVVFLCGVAAYLWSQNELSKTNLNHAEQRLTVVERDNAKLGEAVVFLASQREKDTESYRKLASAIESEQHNHRLLQDKLKALEKSNADVKAYLNERVPDDLRRLLDGDTTSTTATDSEDKTSSSSVGRMSGS